MGFIFPAPKKFLLKKTERSIRGFAAIIAAGPFLSADAAADVLTLREENGKIEKKEAGHGQKTEKAQL